MQPDIKTLKCRSGGNKAGYESVGPREVEARGRCGIGLSVLALRETKRRGRVRASCFDGGNEWDRDLPFLYFEILVVVVVVSTVNCRDVFSVKPFAFSDNQESIISN